MAESDEAAGFINSIRSMLDTLTKLNWEELSGHDVQKDLRIDLRHYVEPTIAFASECAEASLLSKYSVPALTVFQAALQDLIGAVNHLRSYYQVVQNTDLARQRHNDTVQNVRRLSVSAQGALLPFARVPSRALASEVRTLMEEVDESRQRLLNEAARIVADHDASQTSLIDSVKAVRELEQQAQTALASAKAAAAHRTATQLSEIFREAAAKHEKGASAWLKASIVVACAMLLLATLSAAGFLKEAPAPHQEWYIAQNLGYFATRVLIASIFSFLLVVFVRNHRAAMHNSVTNAHRARALDAFHGFESSAREGRAKDVILVHAADAVFSAQASGYAAGEPLGATHVGELLASVKEPPSSGSG